MTKMDPAIRDYQNKMRDDAFIYLKQGYTDSGATYAELHPSIGFSQYVPPAPKKKAKVERTRFRESTHTFRQKGGTEAPAAAEAAAPADQSAQAAPAQQTASANQKQNKNVEQATEKPGKKEKIRYGQAPRETLPTATTNTATENAGALPETASNDEPANPLEPTAPTKKTRFSDRARETKSKQTTAADGTTAPAPDAAEVADRQQQSAPLEPESNNKKKKAAPTTSEKTRMSQEKKKPADATDATQKPAQQPTPIAPVPGAPAPADHPEQPQSQPAATPPSQ
jgi:peptidyl-prolyl cis-trans isomerase SurA